MNKLFARIWIPIACLGVMFVTALCLMAFYIAVGLRKLFVKDFMTNAQIQAAEAEKSAQAAKVGSASSQMNAIARKLEKGEQASSNSNSI